MVAALLCPCVLGQDDVCDDMNTDACELLHSSNTDLCEDPALSETACPRYCNLCRKCLSCLISDYKTIHSGNAVRTVCYRYIYSSGVPYFLILSLKNYYHKTTTFMLSSGAPVTPNKQLAITSALLCFVNKFSFKNKKKSIQFGNSCFILYQNVCNIYFCHLDFCIYLLGERALYTLF